MNDTLLGEVETEVEAMPAAPRPDPDEAWRFLKAHYEGRVVNLCDKRPDKDGMFGWSIGITDDARAVVERWVGARPDRNLYFGLNTVRPGLAKKAAKEDVTGIEGLGGDVDPPKDRSLAKGQKEVVGKVAKLKGMQHPP